MRLSLLKTSTWFLVICLLYKCGSPVLADDSNEEDDAVVEEESVDDDASIVEDINYETPKPSGLVYLYESFDDQAKYKKRWVLSTARKEDAEVEISKYDGKWSIEQSKENSLKGDYGLVLKSKAKHHAAAVLLDKPFNFEKKPLIVQYEVNFQDGQECGGAYLKLLSAAPDLSLANFHDKTPYTIMFGPDKCGSDHKVHFIFRHKNPINGTFSEKHSKQPDSKPLEDQFKDKKSHLYTLVIRPDNTYDMLIDQISVVKGSLLEDFTPPVNPPKEIDDPYDRKPEDWDEREKIPDPNARKPDDWDEDAPRQLPDPSSVKPEDWLDDEPEMIPDPNAEKPNDWEDEMDGEWEAPLVANPKCEKAGCGLWKPAMLDNPNYKGKWRAPLVANPNYKGKWKPQKIPNADYFEDDNPFKMTSIGAVGLELWSMSPDILFDNIVVAGDKSIADYIASQSWELKRRKADRDAETIVKRIIKYTNKHPWLWAVYVVVIGLPIVLIFVFCCTSSDDKKRAAHAKKTDAPTPDDEPLSEPAPAVSKEPLSTKPEVKPPVIEELPDKEESQDENEEKDEETEKNEKDASEEAEIEEASGGSHDGSGDIGKSPRRRRPRRD